ncbi:cytochrome C [Brevundimonas sp. Root1423]|uniref:cytochrome C n=1 Tax=Brevundimonas sp. Root1423 TaxID=1736462 RepID=UPI001F3F345A|nr:cytochrome C [Brevundimonas sp. Root1423]
MRTATIALGAAFLTALAACQPGDAANTVEVDLAGGPRVVAASDIEAGRYIVATSGCNDCHTPMYARTGGAQPPEAEWLKGSPEPHTGPWGTSYGKNLRLTAAANSEDEWVELLSTGSSLPPMPWPSVRNMSDYDKRAIYRYIKSMKGDRGQPAPDPLPAGAAPVAPTD